MASLIESLPDCAPETLPGVRAISADQLKSLLDMQRHQPLTPGDDIFPYLHGVTRDNPVQWAFFCESQNLKEVGPPRQHRSVLIIHANAEAGDNYPGRLVGSFKADSILGPGVEFLHTQPPTGITLRNFNIQPAKMAVISDIVVYDHQRAGVTSRAALEVAERAVLAQRWARQQWPYLPAYSTCILTDSWDDVEKRHPELVGTTSEGLHRHGADFVAAERQQMNEMSRMSEISTNVFIGTDRDWEEQRHSDRFGIHIQCEDFVEPPSIDELVAASLNNAKGGILDFSMPSSGSVERHKDVALAALTDACAFIYTHATGSELAIRRKDSQRKDKLTPQPQRVLITCRDGYTETSFLALAYLIYSKGLRPDEAWLHLHRELKRDFYAFPEDVSALSHAANSLLQASPIAAARVDSARSVAPAQWFGRPAALAPLENVSIANQTIEAVKLSKKDTGAVFTGSFPSRILPHLYLGNLEHANNVWMLKELGITSVLSLGEAPLYGHADKIGHIPPHRRLVHDLQDDAIDSILPELSRSLAFIEEAHRAGRITLVHCRVGVSRSASVCIAEVSRRLQISVPEAYIYVRARRLNVIIQPNLRFMYELMHFDQLERTRQKAQQQQQRQQQQKLDKSYDGSIGEDVAPPLRRMTDSSVPNVPATSDDERSYTASGSNTPSLTDGDSLQTVSRSGAAFDTPPGLYMTSAISPATDFTLEFSSDRYATSEPSSDSPAKKQRRDSLDGARPPAVIQQEPQQRQQLEPKVMEWAELAWHIARLNKLYISQSTG